MSTQPTLEAFVRQLSRFLRSGRWPQTAVEDFLAVSIIRMGFDPIKLGPAGIELFERFLTRAGIDSADTFEACRAKCEAYLQEHPVPPGLLAEINLCIQAAEQGKTDRVKEGAAVLLDSPSSWRPVQGGRPGPGSLFGLRLRRGQDEDSAVQRKTRKLDPCEPE